MQIWRPSASRKRQLKTCTLFNLRRYLLSSAKKILSLSTIKRTTPASSNKPCKVQHCQVSSIVRCASLMKHFPSCVFLFLAIVVIFVPFPSNSGTFVFDGFFKINLVGFHVREIRRAKSGRTRLWWRTAILIRGRLKSGRSKFCVMWNEKSKTAANAESSAIWIRIVAGCWYLALKPNFHGPSAITTSTTFSL